MSYEMAVHMDRFPLRRWPAARAREGQAWQDFMHKVHDAELVQGPWHKDAVAKCTVDGVCVGEFLGPRDAQHTKHKPNSIQNMAGSLLMSLPTEGSLEGSRPNMDVLIS